MKRYYNILGVKMGCLPQVANGRIILPPPNSL